MSHTCHCGVANGAIYAAFHFIAFTFHVQKRHFWLYIASTSLINSLISAVCLRTQQEHDGMSNLLLCQWKIWVYLTKTCPDQMSLQNQKKIKWQLNYAWRNLSPFLRVYSFQHLFWLQISTFHLLFSLLESVYYEYMSNITANGCISAGLWFGHRHEATGLVNK